MCGVCYGCYWLRLLGLKSIIVGVCNVVVICIVMEFMLINNLVLFIKMVNFGSVKRLDKLIIFLGCV